MIGIYHLTIIGFGILGLILGGVLIDLDHNGPWSCKWKLFWSNDPCVLEAGFMHKPVILLSIISFSFCLALGLTTHLLADFINYIR